MYVNRGVVIALYLFDSIMTHVYANYLLIGYIFHAVGLRMTEVGGAIAYSSAL